MKKVGVIQPNYIPWKGYFDIINMADEFILYDDVQYTTNDWRNRNKIKTCQGVKWLTIPVKYNSLHQKINEVEVADNIWRKKHWKTIVQNYAKAPFFKNYKDIFEKLYLCSEEKMLTEINYNFTEAINEILGVKTKISWASDYRLVNRKEERLLDLLKKVNASEYISGPSAKDYIDEKVFQQEGVKLIWMDYSNYPEYEQLFPPFENCVSILDLIFNEGPNATKYMKSFKPI